MTSRRSYERTTAVSSSLSLWGSGFIKSRNRQAVTHYREESDSEKNRFSKNTKDSKEDLFQQFKQAQSIGSPISMSQRSTPDLHTIKSQSLSYLMMLLFGEGSLMRDSFRNSTAGQVSSGVSPYQLSGGNYTEFAYQAETFPVFQGVRISYPCHKA